VPTQFSSKSFGAKVRALRDQLGFSQEKLAELSGLHRTYISDVERGARNISLNSINKLAAALAVSAASLLEYPELGLPAKTMEILLIADAPEAAEAIVAALKSAKILNQPQVVPDAAAALKLLQGGGEPARAGAGPPLLVLLDLDLANEDGLEVLHRIKSDPRTGSIPVIVLVDSGRGKDLAICKRLGAGGHIVKPVGLQKLVEVTAQLSCQWALMESDPAAQA